jgi:DNA-binding MarR family transcriptional regulator
MVVKSTPAPDDRVASAQIDLAYLGFFLGLRVNEMVRERGQAHGHHGMRDSYGFVIQHLIESDRSITELARRMEVSQQAASKSIAELVRRGIVEARVAEDRRTRRVRLSKRGWELVRFTRNARHAIDTRLQLAVGTKDYDNARKTLMACLESLGGIGRVRTRRVKPPAEMSGAHGRSR